MKLYPSRSIAVLLLTALVAAASFAQSGAAPSSGTGGTAASGAGGTSSAGGRSGAGGTAASGTGTGMSPGQFMMLFKETTVLVSEQEQQLLEEQRAGITQNDKRRAKQDKVRRDAYAEWEKSVISTNYRQFKGLAEGEKEKYPSTGEKAMERVMKIEEMKRNILRFERFYDESSEEVASLLSSLEDYYEELEGDTYTASSFAGDLIVRGEDYGAADDGWRVTVYSELFGMCSLFRYGDLLEYKDLIKKGGSLLGSSGIGGLDKDACIKVIDSLFARAVPVLFATLKYRLVRGSTASQYRIIPVSLTLTRTDNLKVVLTAGRDFLAQGSFTMDPQLAVASPAAMAQAAGGTGAKDRGGRSSDEHGTASSGRTSSKKKESGSSSSKDSSSKGSSSGGSSKGGSASSGHGSAAGDDYPDADSSSGGFMGQMLATQKKRRALFLTMDTAIVSLADYNIKDLELNSMKLNFDFANNDYFFYGGGLSWRYAGRNSESFYGAFVNGGANITLFRNFRPYVFAEASANTGAELGLGAGCGIDFTIKHLLLNLNGAFNWSYDADLKVGAKSSTFATVGTAGRVTRPA